LQVLPAWLFPLEFDPAIPSQIVAAADAVVRDGEELLTVSCPQVGIVKSTFMPVRNKRPVIIFEAAKPGILPASYSARSLLLVVVRTWKASDGRIGFAVRTRHIGSLLGELMWHRNPPYLNRFSACLKPTLRFCRQCGVIDDDPSLYKAMELICFEH
jgi:hypothetical protein